MLLRRMFLRICLEFLIGDTPSPDERSDQGKSPISFCAFLRSCRCVIDGWNLISSAVHPLWIALRCQPPHTVDLITAYQALRLAEIPFPFVFAGQLIDIIPRDRDGICHIPQDCKSLQNSLLSFLRQWNPVLGQQTIKPMEQIFMLPVGQFPLSYKTLPGKCPEPFFVEFLLSIGPKGSEAPFGLTSSGKSKVKDLPPVA